MTDALHKLREQAIAFAEELVSQDLARPTSVARWRTLLEKLAGRDWLAPQRSYAETGALLEGLARGGADMGVPLTLTVHYLLCRKVLAASAPKALEKIRGGAGLCCMAASEPGAGSHPKKITAAAVRDEGGRRLSGRKTFTTGGPLAAYLLVLAVCGESPEGRDLGLFLVPTESEGVRIGQMPVHPGLEAALHGDITLESVRVPDAARIGGTGAKDNGWTRIVKPFRQWEDALLQSWVAGLARRCVRELASAAEPNGPLAPLLGRLSASTRALATLARDSAASLDDEETGADPRDLTARRYGFFEQLRQNESLANEIGKNLKEAPPPLQRLRALGAQAGFAAQARGKIVAGLVGR